MKSEAVSFALALVRTSLNVAGRRTAEGGEPELRDKCVALVGCHRPRVRVVIKRGGGDLGLELYIALQVELVGHEVQVLPDLRMFRIALGPFPCLLNVLIKRIA